MESEATFLEGCAYHVQFAEIRRAVDRFEDADYHFEV
jgi:hypothetical protein